MKVILLILMGKVTHNGAELLINTLLSCYFYHSLGSWRALAGRRQPLEGSGFFESSAGFYLRSAASAGICSGFFESS